MDSYQETGMEKKWDVLGFGAVAVDDLVYVDRYPMPDTKVKVLDQVRQGGGLVGTALVAASRLGARAAYAGILGDDDLSRYTLDEFTREGVDCSSVLFRPDARPIHALIIVDSTNGLRSILPSFVGVQWRRPDEIPAALIAACRVLLVDHHAVEGGLHAIRLAHQYGVQVVADVERETEPLGAELASAADHLIVSVGYAQTKTGITDPAEGVRVLHNGRACTAVTAGEQGSWYMEKTSSEVIHQPAYKVKVVDTNGCGDVFHGAYAAMLVRGEPVKRAMKIAAAAAALKATKPGGRAGCPTLAEAISCIDRAQNH